MPNDIDSPLEAWFADADDGTIIHIFGNSELISYEQSTYEEFCSNTVEAGNLEMVDPLPADFVGNRSGSISRLTDRFILYLEEWTPSRIGANPALASNGLAISLNRSYISRYQFINVEQLGTSNGQPNQSFTVSGSAILTPTIGTPIILINGTDKWARTDDLSLAGATDNVFEYDAVTGTVTFGNGTLGAIPPSGQTVTLRITIKNGGGKWQFVDIVEQTNALENLGAVKSARDKAFFGKCKVACVDASKMTSVTSVLNGKSIKVYSAETGDLLAERRVYGVYYGAEINATGGEIITYNTTAEGVVLNKTGSEPPHLLDIDLTVKYPDLRATMDELPALVTGGCPEPGIKEQTRVTKMSGGAVTDPKHYLTTMYVYPIAQVVEYFRYGIAYSTTADGGGGLPCPGPYGEWHFLALPAYQIRFQLTGTQGSNFQLPNSNVFDSDGAIINQSTRPISGRGDGIPQLIQIGDQVGDFDSPLPPPATPFNNGYFEPDGNLSYDITHSLSATETFTIPITRYNNSVFQRTVSGSTTSLFGSLVIMKYEVRSTQAHKDYENYMLGEELPDFQCTWTVTPGTLTEYENIIAGRMLGFGFGMAGCSTCALNFHSVEDGSFGTVSLTGYQEVFHLSPIEYIRVHDPCFPIFGALDYPAELRHRDLIGAFQVDFCACQEVFDVCGVDIC